MTSPRDEAPTRLEARDRRVAIAALLLPVIISTVDISLTSTALPSIARDIGADSATSIWVVNAYYLVVVASLLPLAAMGEVFGHRRVFLAGQLLFLLGALASALAWSLPSLVVSRAVLGLGTAAISAVTPALIRHIYPLNQLGRGLGLYVLVVGVSFTAGPTLASLILSVATWPWLYLPSLPLGLLALALSLRRLPGTERSAHGFDLVSAGLCAALFALLLFGLAGIAHRLGWLAILAAWAAALGCGLALLRREAGRPAPILAMDLFRIPLFALSSATSICAFAVQGLAFVALPFLLHNVLGYSQAETGLIITPWPAALAVMALVAAPMGDRYPPGILGGCGLLVLMAGLTSVALLPADAGPWGIGWRLALCGVGFGFFQSPNMRAIMAAAPRERAGGASGIVATSRLLGQAIGAAIVALCLSIWPREGAVLALWFGCGAAALGSLASFLRLLPSVRNRA